MDGCELRVKLLMNRILVSLQGLTGPIGPTGPAGPNGEKVLKFTVHFCVEYPMLITASHI